MHGLVKRLRVVTAYYSPESLRAISRKASLNASTEQEASAAAVRSEVPVGRSYSPSVTWHRLPTDTSQGAIHFCAATARALDIALVTCDPAFADAPDTRLVW